MSYSKKECYEDCPRKFFYKYVKYLEEPYRMVPDNPLICGSAVDKGLEEALTTGILSDGILKANEYYTNIFTGMTEAHEWELWKIEIAIEKLYDYYHEVGLATIIEQQYEINQEFVIESDNGDKQFLVIWRGYIDGLTHNTIVDNKYSSRPEAYRESQQLNVYSYLLNPNKDPSLMRNIGGYIVAVKSKLVRHKEKGSKPQESILDYQKRLRNAMSVQFINCPPNLLEGEIVIDRGHDIICEIYDKNGVADQDVNHYAKTGAWCKNCTFLELCGGK